MATGEVDRTEWAKIVRALIDELTRGKKATFARMLGMDPKTIDNWLNGRVRVSEESIRNVAEVTGRSALEWLVQVGYYQVDELPRISPEQFNEERRLVLDSDLDNDQKADILRELDRMEAEDQEALQLLLEKDRRRRRERVMVLLQQKRSA